MPYQAERCLVNLETTAFCFPAPDFRWEQLPAMHMPQLGDREKPTEDEPGLSIPSWVLPLRFGTLLPTSPRLGKHVRGGEV